MTKQKIGFDTNSLRRPNIREIIEKRAIQPVVSTNVFVEYQSIDTEERMQWIYRQMAESLIVTRHHPDIIRDELNSQSSPEWKRAEGSFSFSDEAQRQISTDKPKKLEHDRVCECAAQPIWQRSTGQTGNRAIDEEQLLRELTGLLEKQERGLVELFLCRHVQGIDPDSFSRAVQAGDAQASRAYFGLNLIHATAVAKPANYHFEDQEHRILLQKSTKGDHTDIQIAVSFAYCDVVVTDDEKLRTRLKFLRQHGYYEPEVLSSEEFVSRYGRSSETRS